MRSHSPLAVLSVLLLSVLAACRSAAAVQAPHAHGCSAACPGVPESAVADAGAVLRGDVPAPRAEPVLPAPSTAAFLCPMHPHVGADEAGARCPECNMKLRPRAEVLEALRED